ncbi:hypothetical protein V8D89_013851 [Ganoderma adspersum]
MVNVEGRNQHGGKLVLALTRIFRQFNWEKDGAGLSVKEQLARLRSLGCKMSRMSMYKIKQGSAAECLQAVLDLKESDVQGRWGVAQVRQRLANKGVSISRDELRVILHDHFDFEFDRRFPGKMRDAIPRVPLDCIGPMHQVHVDDHEKLSSEALRLGTVTLPIYAFRDLWGGLVFMLVVLPNVRLASTCAHLYLDFVEDHGAIPLTMVSDKGSETVQMIEFQKLLRRDAAPEIPEHEFKPQVQVQSKHNTPVKGVWLWLREGEGHNIRDVILRGAIDFDADDLLHVNNNHTVRRQKEKDLPSGTSPIHMWTCPTDMRPTAGDCQVNVRADIVRGLRDEIGGEEARRQAYQFLGSPHITLTTAWAVFLAIVDELRSCL